MFIKKFDVLSPSITLYYKEETQHSSIFSGLLSMIVFALVFTAEIYYFLSFIERLHPKAYFFNRYTEDAGTFPVNASAMFNFIQLVDPFTNEIKPFDFEALSVVGFDRVLSDEYMNDPTTKIKEDHWVYGYCNNDSDTEGISHLINFEHFEKSACIRKYYDKNKGRLFSTGEKGFRWPIIEKGCSNPDRTYYGIIIQRCDKAPEELREAGTETCKNNDGGVYIDGIISKVSLKFQLITHYADMLNYDKPFTKIFQDVTSAITDGTYSINHLNYNPAQLLTYNGYFFENITEDTSFFYVQNDKQTLEDDTNGCLIGIYFWMQNMLQHYERNYDRIQDILANIGGVCYVVVSVASIMNILVNKFVTLLDTDNLISNPENLNQKEGPIIFKRSNDIMYPPKKLSGLQNKLSNIEEGPDLSNVQNSMKDLHTGKIKDEQFISNALKVKKKVNNNNGPIKKKQMTNTKNVTNNIIKNRVQVNINDKSNLNNNNSCPKLYENDEKTVSKTFSLFFSYIWYLIKCKSDYPTFSYYEKFRSKIISEENIIQSHFDLLNISKIKLKQPYKSIFQ